MSVMMAVFLPVVVLLECLQHAHPRLHLVLTGSREEEDTVWSVQLKHVGICGAEREDEEREDVHVGEGGEGREEAEREG